MCAVANTAGQRYPGQQDAVAVADTLMAFALERVQ